MPIQYHNFDLLIERSGDNFKARVLESPAGEATTIFHLPFPPAEVENFFVQIGHSRLIETSQMQKMRAFGQELFEAAFTGNVRDKFRESLNEVNRNREGLRIRLRIADVPELANMPWEFMYDASLSRFLTLSIETPVVRYLDVPRDIQPLTIRPPLQILAVISSPRDFPSLNVGREWDNLQEALNRLESRKLVHLTRLEKPTLQTLQRQLRRGEYHIFHFIGHGIFSKHKQDGQLLFEDELKGGDPVSSQDLGILLHDHRHLRLAVLNACEGARTSMEDQFSGTAQNLIRQGLPAVIAMQLRITDIAAITLAREFYSALADGYPVDAAITEARKAIKTHGNELEWGTPVLYMRSPNGQIFDVESIRTATKIAASASKPTPEQIKQVEKTYTEALEAYYLEKWDVAFQKLQAVLDSNPDHKDAADKLEIARRKVQLLSLHEKAAKAESEKDWGKAIELLEALQKEDSIFENVKARLAKARREEQLNDLYEEAQRLIQAEKWEAVLSVFSKIQSLDPKYPDAQGFRLKAEKQLADTKRIRQLDNTYNQALKEIDTGEWGQAIKSLKKVRKLQTNYRETEQLIKRAESELTSIKTRKSEASKTKIGEVDLQITKQSLKAFVVFSFARVILELLFKFTVVSSLIDQKLGGDANAFIYLSSFGILLGTAIWWTFGNSFISKNWKNWGSITLTSTISVTSLFFGAIFLSSSGADNWVWTLAWAITGLLIGLALAWNIRYKTPSTSQKLFWQLPVIWAIAFILGQQIAGEIDISLGSIGVERHSDLSLILESGISGLIGSMFTLLNMIPNQPAWRKSNIITTSAFFIVIIAFSLATGFQNLQRNFVPEPYAGAIGDWTNSSKDILSIRRSLFTGKYKITYVDHINNFDCNGGTGQVTITKKILTETLYISDQFRCRNLSTTYSNPVQLIYNPNIDTLVSSYGNISWKRK